MKDHVVHVESGKGRGEQRNNTIDEDTESSESKSSARGVDLERE
jgi:hypothetical protein